MPSTDTAFDSSQYIGIHAQCPDSQQAAVLLENSTISRSVYRPGSVDHAFFDQALILHDDTADYAYTAFTPLDQPYVRGSRCFLEKIVAHVTAGLRTPAEQAIALNDWVRDLPLIYPRSSWGGFGEIGEPFHGGAEEEVIRKGSSMCNEMARVLGILAQIAGFPSRYVGHMTPIDYDNPRSGTGHGVNEIFIDGQWAYFDIRGRYFLKDDGSFASAWDLIQDPGLVDRQSEEVCSHRCSRSNHASFRAYYERPAVTIIANYLAADHARYDYSWVYPSPIRAMEAREAGRALRVSRHREILPQPRTRIV